MTGYEILVAPPGFSEGREAADDQVCSDTCETDEEKAPLIFATPKIIESKYPVPSAFEKYAKMINIRTGKEREESTYENTNCRDTEL
jgi:hypothetical protein